MGLASHKWSYNPYKKGYNPSYPFISGQLGVITPLITDDGAHFVAIKTLLDNIQGTLTSKVLNLEVGDLPSVSSSQITVVFYLCVQMDPNGEGFNKSLG